MMKKKANDSKPFIVLGVLGIFSAIGILVMKKANANKAPVPGLPSPQQSREEFNETMPFIEELEGGYSESRKDKGNFIDGTFIGTKYGISAPTLMKWIGRKPTAAEMKALTKAEAHKIYYEWYWKPFAWLDIKNRNVRNVIFDFTITSGQAFRQVQILLNDKYRAGLAEDNKMGPKTIAAINSVPNQQRLFEEIKAKRIEYYRTLDTWSANGDGWMNRVNKWVYA